MPGSNAVPESNSVARARLFPDHGVNDCGGRGLAEWASHTGRQRSSSLVCDSRGRFSSHAPLSLKRVGPPCQRAQRQKSPETHGSSGVSREDCLSSPVSLALATRDLPYGVASCCDWEIGGAGCSLAEIGKSGPGFSPHDSCDILSQVGTPGTNHWVTGFIVRVENPPQPPLAHRPFVKDDRCAFAASPADATLFRSVAFGLVMYMQVDMTTVFFRSLRSGPLPPSRMLCMVLLAGFLLVPMLGCNQQAAIEPYVIPTKMPAELVPSKERMLASMFAKGENVWFFKVLGPEEAVDQMDEEFRRFVETISFTDQGPDLSALPEGWRRGADKPMRFASVDVNTPNKQLDVSISSLPRQEDWDEQVKSNVNRWRGQLGLSPSDAKWADGQPFQVETADGEAVWVDLIGDPQESSSSMSPPFAQMGGGPMSGAMSGAAATAGQGPAGQATASNDDPRLSFQRPEGWRDGKKSSMRLASFDVGPEDAVAELTVIPAGGDLRGNVARWLGQVRGGSVPDEVVDQALEAAQKLEVDGRPAQRFLLFAEDASSGDAIDATIIPLNDGISLFVKMTGPAETITDQAEAIASFLESLKLNL